MIVVLLAAMAATAVSGWLLTTDAFWGSTRCSDVHSALADGALALVVLHLGGVALASLRHRENLVRAMVVRRQAGRRTGRRRLTRCWRGTMTETQNRRAVFLRRRHAAHGGRDRRRHLSHRDGGGPGPPGKVEAIDIILSVEYAEAVIAQLSSAVITVRGRRGAL